MPIENNDFSSMQKSIDPATRKALEAVGLSLMGQAMRVCPVGKYPKGSGKVGGNLRRSHKYQVESSNAVIVGVTAEYGGYVHDGTSKQAANPWLRNALEQNKGALGRLFFNTLRGGMS